MEDRGPITYIHAIHQVTGEMALIGFGKNLSSDKLEDWALALIEVAGKMRVLAREMDKMSKKKRRK